MENSEKNLQIEGKYLISLLRAALRGVAPEPAPVDLDWNGLFSVAKQHTVDAAVYRTVAALGSCPEEILSEWKMQADNALRLEILFDAERTRLFKQFDENKINYIPLKGIILKGFYPRKGMRRFADNDILFDKKKRKQMQKIMLSDGYAAQEYYFVHDTYVKPPVYNFEMHKMLFKRSEDIKYFKDVWARAIKEEGDNCAYRLSDDDFYLSNIAHFHVHSREAGGAGIRFYADLWLMLQNLQLNRDLIDKVLKDSDLADFEREVREIAMCWFGDDPKDIPDEIFDIILTGGVFGTYERSVQAEVKGGMTLFRLMFLPYKQMCERFPCLKYLPFLLPFCWAIRLVGALFSKRKLRKGRMVAKYRAEEKKKNG